MKLSQLKSMKVLKGPQPDPETNLVDACWVVDANGNGGHYAYGRTPHEPRWHWKQLPSGTSQECEPE